MPPANRRRVGHARNGVPRWTLEERQTLHLLKTEWDLTDQQVMVLFHGVYPNMAAEGRNYDESHLRDAWKSRFLKGKNPQWRQVDRPNEWDQTPYSQEELNEFARLRHDIEQTAVTASIDLSAIAVVPPPNTVGGTNRGASVTPAADLANNQVDDDGGEEMDDIRAEADAEEEPEEMEGGDVGNFRQPTEEQNADANEDREDVKNDVNVEKNSAVGVDDGEANKSSQNFGIDDTQRPEVASATGASHPGGDNTLPGTTAPAAFESNVQTGISRKRLFSALESNPLEKPGDQPITTAKLDMVHFCALAWTDRERVEYTFNGLSAAVRKTLKAGAFIKEDSAVYKYGGPLMKVFFGGGNKDVMVCNRDICKVCNSSAEEAESEADSPTGGLPLVHHFHVATREFVRNDHFDMPRWKYESGEAVILRKDRFMEYTTTAPEKWETGNIRLDSAVGPKKVYAEVRICSSEKKSCEYCDAKTSSAGDVLARMGPIQHRRL